MKTLTLTVPDGVELDAREAAMLLATRLYEQGRFTLGQAAEFAGYSKHTFMELMGQYGVSLFNYDEDELDNDIKNTGGHGS